MGKDIQELKIEKEYGYLLLPSNFNPSNPIEIEHEFKKLLEISVIDEKGLEKFLHRWSELSSAIEEYSSQCYVNMTVNTRDRNADEEYNKLINTIVPVLEEKSQEIKDYLLKEIKTIPQGFDLFFRKIRSDAEIFRKDNISLFMEDMRLSQEYQKVSGSWMAEFDGKKRTLQELSIFLESPERKIREDVWRIRNSITMADKKNLTELYTKMVQNRTLIAKNAGFKNYRDYKFVEQQRFDYTPDDCMRFHEAIEEVIVPVVARWVKEKSEKMKLDSFRPWDVNADPDGGLAIRAFEKADELVQKTQNVFRKIHPKLGESLEYMKKKSLLDLESREGKAPGGYMTDYSLQRLPFIFMNATGTKRDVETLLHEGGHAFHVFASRELPLKFYRSSPLEFAEVASMSMELMARPFFNEFYSEDVLRKIKIEQLMKILEFYPFMSMIDLFQHEVYTTNSQPDDYDKIWHKLSRRFQGYLDWSGLEEAENTRWQYPHVFTVPFYYIEYGIAQTGALQLWKESLKDRENAVKQYYNGLSLGGSKPLPELFQAAGIHFAMDKKTLRSLVETVMENLTQ